jgi:hypothetical protein
MPIEPLSLVEIDCKPLDPDPIRGFFLLDNRSMVALHSYDSGLFALHGFTIVRRDVIRSSRFIPSSDMMFRIYKAKRLKPAAPKGVDFSNWRSLVESSSREFPLITIYRERIRRGKCLIGVPIKTNSQALWLYTVSPEAEWDDVVRIPYRDITRLDFGGEYERWLYRFSGPPKPPLD